MASKPLIEENEERIQRAMAADSAALVEVQRFLDSVPDDEPESGMNRSAMDTRTSSGEHDADMIQALEEANLAS